MPRDKAGHLVLSVLKIPVPHALPVRDRSILAHLPFSTQFADAYLYADDTALLRIDEPFGRVADGPRRLPARFMPVGERGDLCMQPVGIVMDDRLSARLHDQIVPGRHDLVVFCFGGIPGRGDIGLLALEDDEHRRRLPEHLPLLVGACDVSEKNKAAVGALRQERDRIGLDRPVGVADQQAERMGLDERLELFLLGDCEMRRLIHGRSHLVRMVVVHLRRTIRAELTARVPAPSRRRMCNESPDHLAMENGTRRDAARSPCASDAARDAAIDANALPGDIG